MGKGRVKREPDSLIKMGKLARLASGRSQRSVAIAMGKSFAWVCQVEGGWTDPPISSALDYLRECGVRVEAHFDSPAE